MMASLLSTIHNTVDAATTGTCLRTPSSILKWILIMADVNENNDHLVKSDDPDHPANLIPRLCRQFYTLGILDRLDAPASMTET